MLAASNAQFYDSFGASEPQKRADLFSSNFGSNANAEDWDERDMQIVCYAVEQERLRLQLQSLGLFAALIFRGDLTSARRSIPGR
jgi:hypothetical protein